jgi:hypothetical protein
MHGGAEAFLDCDVLDQDGCIVPRPDRRDRDALGPTKDVHGYENTPAVEVLVTHHEAYCSTCSTSWKPDSPHDCRIDAILDALRTISEDADDSHNEVSLFFDWLEARLNQHGRRFDAIEERVEEQIIQGKQFTLPFADEAVSRALKQFVIRLDKTQEQAGTLARGSASMELHQRDSDAKLKEMEIKLTEARSLVDAASKQMAAVADLQQEQAKEIVALRAENKALAARIQSNEDGLFG